MQGHKHYIEAERLLDTAALLGEDRGQFYLQLATVHAVLAQTAALVDTRLNSDFVRFSDGEDGVLAGWDEVTS